MLPLSVPAKAQGPAKPAADTPRQSGAAAVSSPRVRDARRDLLDRIAAFAIRHDLDVNSANLAAICNALSGSNAQLAHAFAMREMSSEPIDQRWLDTIMRLDPDTKDRLSELEELTDKLEYSLVRFAQTAKSAADETSDQRCAINAQILAMKKAAIEDGGPTQVERVIELSRSMLEGIEKLEGALVKSHAETETLRESLAKARMEADVDHLTRLPNRRAFERRLEQATSKARMKGEKLCIAFCDIDNFKAINDTHGHNTGDRILCVVASTLSDIAGDDCFLARHGGEEFVLLFYGLNKEETVSQLDAVRRAMAVTQVVNRETGRPVGKVTFSGGVAEVTEHDDPRGALAQADAALYEAKNNGRNRIVSI